MSTIAWASLARPDPGAANVHARRIASNARPAGRARRKSFPRPLARLAGPRADARPAVWLAAPHLERAKTLLWLDAVGLAAYSVIGAAKALSLGVDPLVSAAMGVLTACFGGVIRDVLAGQPSVLLKREIYVTAAILAAGLFVALQAWGLPPIWAGIAGALAGFALRAGAIQFRWALPAFAMKRDGGA